jgi:hypothetical protein
MHTTSAESIHDHQREMNMVFTNCSKEDVIFVKKIAQAQKDDAVLKKPIKNVKYSPQLAKDTQLLCKDGKMVIPTVLQSQAVIAGITTSCSILDTLSWRDITCSNVL